jgi:hypothetical protein
MARQAIRSMKQSLHAGMAECASEEQRLHAKQAALSLLERSVRMGHRRLAVIRLHASVLAGATVPDEHWRYCHNAAAACKDVEVNRLYIASMVAAAATTEFAKEGQGKCVKPVTGSLF